MLDSTSSWSGRSRHRSPECTERQPAEPYPVWHAPQLGWGRQVRIVENVLLLSEERLHFVSSIHGERLCIHTDEKWTIYLTVAPTLRLDGVRIGSRALMTRNPSEIEPIGRCPAARRSGRFEMAET